MAKPRANEVEDTSWTLRIAQVARKQKRWARAESRNISQLSSLDVNRDEDKNLRLPGRKRTRKRMYQTI